MQATPYRTDRGVGWIAYSADRPCLIVLPGGERPAPEGDPPVEIGPWVARVESWFAGRGRGVVDEELCERAGRTPFEREVYRIVAAIPPGRTMTYGAVAAAAGRPGAARAVGAAMARNPFAPLIPCHRVVGSDGRLRGYGGGLDMKASLLEEEAHA